MPAGLLLRPTRDDFSQFYLGGAIAREGKWTALYPQPWSRLDNAGLHSTGTPDWKTLSKRRGAPDYTHFILPPPTALAFAPLSLLPYRQAYWLWIALLTHASWLLALLAARLFRELAGKPSRLEGALILLIAISPLTARAIRVANVTPLIALSFAVALLALTRRRALPGALALFAGSTLKYATLILAPLLIAMRQWRLLGQAALMAALSLTATFALAGAPIFSEFQDHILPTLSRPSAYLGNQSLPGMMARSFGRPLPGPIAASLSVLRAGSLLLLLALHARVHPKQWRTPATILAAAAALIAWLLIFSPIAWEHWPIFLCPVWGWILWEGFHHREVRALCAVSLLLMYFPAGIIQVPGIATWPVKFPEPWNSWQLFGVMLLFLLAGRRLGISRVLTQTKSLSENPVGAEPARRSGTPTRRLAG